ncbi:MAG: tetratricopeptide repeat protein [Planctomycetales bacterium]|nr:tetratricopeptide repeat protein [Planctomycetales bacterium]
MSAFLADFGLAKLAETGSRLTRTGQALGTPAYMSPEQARGEVSSLTPGTDVWSLGCVLYEMLGRRPPFEGDRTAAVVGKVLLEEAPLLSSLRGDMPREVERVVQVCLGKRARDRYPDALALRDDLDRALRGDRLRAGVPWSRGRKAVAAAISGVAAALAALALGPREERPAPAPVPAARSHAGVLADKARSLRQADPRQAARLLGEALAAEPSRADLRLERGLMLWAAGQGREAREEWTRIPAGAPEGASARLYRGLEATFRLDGNAALDDLAGLAPTSGREGPLARGAVAAARGLWADAREVLRDVPGWEAALLRGYVESLDSDGDCSRAVREYEAAFRAGIAFPWAYNSCGAARKSLGDLAGAIADLDRAVELDPSDPKALGNRGNAKRESGDLDGAVADLGRAIELDGSMAKWPYARGLARRALGDYLRAIADYDLAISLDPGYAMAFGSRGSAKLKRGDFAGARVDLDRAIELGLRSATAFGDRGNVRRALADLKGAIADFDRAIELDPGLAVAFNNRGLAKRDLGDLEGAVADFDQAIGRDPRCPLALANRGAVRGTRGDLAGEIADYETALDVAPEAWPHRRTVEAHLARARAALATRERGR